MKQSEHKVSKKAGVSKILSLKREGHTLIIPEGMEIPAVVKWLRQRFEEEEQVIRVTEKTELLLPEGLVAFAQAVEAMFGWAIQSPTVTQGMFGDQESPPQMLSIDIGPEEVTQAPYGQLMIPGISGFLNTKAYFANRSWRFSITGQVKNKDRELVSQLAQLTRDIGKEKSIYKGKAWIPKFPLSDDSPPEDFFPKFMDLSGIEEDSLIFNDDVMAAVEDNVFAPVEYTGRFRDLKIPLKTGVLLEGPFGCGKTLTAGVLAVKAAINGWTYLNCENATNLSQVVELARRFQPAIVFCEDIDQVISGNRDINMNHILNVVDGIGTKTDEIMVVLTTNHVDQINKAMLRPGRLDIVIPISRPGPRAVERLIRRYAGTMLPMNEDITTVSARLEGQIPAMVREVVERSRRSVARRDERKYPKIVTIDLERAASGMIRHQELLDTTEETFVSENEKAAEVLGQHLVTALQNGADGPVAEGR